MNIKQASEQSGVSAPNIRFYEKEGLLTPARRQGNDYRDYTAGNVRTLKLIRMLRAGYAAAGDGGDEQRPFGGGGVDARRRHAFERRFGPHGGREDLGNVEHPRRGGLRRRFAGGTAALVLHLVADVPSFSRRVRHPRLRGSAARGAARGGSPQGCGIQRHCGQLLAGAVHP